MQAFSATQSVESALAIATGKLLELAPQARTILCCVVIMSSTVLG